MFYASVMLMVGLMIFSRRRLTARDLPDRLFPAAGAGGGADGAVVGAGDDPDAGPPGGRRGSEDGQPGGEAFTHGRCGTRLHAGAAVISLPWFDGVNPVMGSIRPSSRPESIVRDITERSLLLTHRPLRVFSRMEAGNYLCWALGPKRAVFLEGHVELYPDPLWQEYLTVSSGGAGWDRVLDKYAVDTLLLDARYHDVLVRRVRRSGGWMEVARSGDALVFERRTPLGDFAGAEDELQKSAADGR